MWNGNGNRTQYHKREYGGYGNDDQHGINNGYDDKPRRENAPDWYQHDYPRHSIGGSFSGDANSSPRRQTNDWNKSSMEQHNGGYNQRRSFYEQFDVKMLEPEHHPNNYSFNRDFYSPHPNVRARTAAEVEQIRRAEGISVYPRDCLPPVTTFDEAFWEAEYILGTLKRQNFTVPTPIQMQSWPIVLSGHNMIGIAETGSGKTLAFLLPAIVHMLSQPDLVPGEGPMALVMAPTRELAIQIHDECVKFADVCHVRSTCIYGGAKKDAQIVELNKVPHLIVATPGRLMDMMQNGFTNMRRVTYVVLDEADRMLDMGFENQIRSIINRIRPDRQTVLWSATWPRDVEEIAAEFVKNPFKVTIGSTELAANHNIRQRFQMLRSRDEKMDCLVDLLEAEQDYGRFLVFCAMKATADEVTMQLRKMGYNALCIHGDKEQGEREWVLEEFKRGSSPIMIATDVAQRGLDIKNVYCVVNYDLPERGEDYVHRIGRSGRAGTRGQSISFVTNKDSRVAGHIIKVLEEAGQDVPDELRRFAGGSYLRSSTASHQGYRPDNSIPSRGNATFSGGWN